MTTSVAGVVRFTRFLRATEICSGGGRRISRQRKGVGKVVVSRRRLRRDDVEKDASISAGKSVDRNLVSRPSRSRKRNRTVLITSTVIVAGDEGERVNSRAGIDAESRIEITSDGIDSDAPIHGGGPSPPD